MGRFSGFDGRVAIVTGRGYGIGAAAAKELAEWDAKVVVADLRREQVDTVVDEIRSAGGEATGFLMDIASEEDNQAAVEFAVETYGGLHLAVNSAGYAREAETLGTYSISEWDRLISSNLNGVAYAMRYQLEQFMDQERTSQCAIVNISSIHGQLGVKGNAAYSAAKHGIVGLTKSAALEYASKAIRINSVSPAFVRGALISTSMDEKDVADTVNRHPLGRLGTPAEVAPLIRFLLSKDASYITGSDHPVDGGYTAGVS